MKHWGLSIVTAPTATPVTKEEFKDHARITHSDEDQYIDNLLKRATSYCEGVTGRTYMPTTLRLTMDGFPQSDRQQIRLPQPPLVSVSSVTYLESSSGTSTTLASSDYTVDSYSEPGRIEPSYNTSWPAAREQQNSLTVQYIAGYSSSNSSAVPLVPERSKQAILMLVSHWYENREPVNIGNIVNQVPLGVDALLALDSIGSYSGAVE